MLARMRMRRPMADKDQGFTLIELLVVIIIIGILAAIAIPVFLNQRKRGVDASMKTDLHNAAVIIATWEVDNPGTAVVAWQNFTAADTITGPLSGLKISPNNMIWVANTSPPAVGAWCLYAANTNASKAVGGGNYMRWRSFQGGLDPNISPGSDCA